MSWMLIIVIIIFLLAIFRGWRRGLLRILFSLVSIIFLIWLFSALNPYISAFLKEHTGLYDRIETWCESSGSSSGLGLIAGSASGTTADWILKGITFLVTLIVALIIVFIIFRLLRLVNRIPVIGKVNRALGLVGGALEGYIVVCLVFLFVSLIAGTQVGGALTEEIESNALLSFLNNNNILLNLNIFK